MYLTPFVVLLDTNLLFPAVLRDTLLRSAELHFYQPRWSNAILDELERNLAATNRMLPAQAARLRSVITQGFPHALVTKYEHLIDAMPNDPKDRHVSAAAVKAGAHLIATANKKHFVPHPCGIDIQSPDEFLSSLYDLNPQVFTRMLNTQARSMRKPPTTLNTLLDGLDKHAPSLVATIRHTAFARP